MMNLILPLLILITTLMLPGRSFSMPRAHVPDSLNTIFDMIYEEGLTVKEIELEFNLAEVENHRRDEKEFPATLRFDGPEGTRESWDIDLNVRGRFRRMTCDFPPLKINFKKDDLKERGLKKHNNFKLVTHCLDNWRGEDFLLREYVAYKLYRTVSDISYRSQLIRIKYIDTASGETIKKYGFILEDEKELAERYDSELCEDCYSVPQDSFDQGHLVRLDLFQYMIGNADWSPVILRNLKMLKPHSGGKYYLVPYDFDFSGFVDASYIRLPANLGIKSVQERVYLGFQHPASGLQQAFDYFQSKKESLFRIIEECDYLSKKSRNHLERYLNSFFKEMEKSDPEYVQLIKAAKKRWKD